MRPRRRLQGSFAQQVQVEQNFQIQSSILAIAMTDWFYFLLLALGFCYAFGLEETEMETEENRYDSSYLMAPKKDNDSPMKSRRFLDSMVDGKIISSLGSLFGDKVKEEADKERKEREKIRTDRLIEKYTRIMNDPEALAELQRQSANAPTLINQQVRRSFSPGFHERSKTDVTEKQLNRKTIDSVELSNGQGKNDPQAQNILVQIVLPPPQGPDCRSQTFRNPDYLENRNREMMMRNQAPSIYLNMVQNYGRQNYFGRSTFPSQSILPISNKIVDLVTDVAEEVADEINYRKFGK